MSKNIVIVILIIVVAGLVVILLQKKPSLQPQNDNKTSILQEKSNDKNIASGVTLNLSGQKLDKLPAYVLVRYDLEELDISNNNITGALPSEIGKLKKLKILKANDNEMTGIPAEVGQLNNLEVLDLSNNQLTGLPNELANLKKLRMLNLSGNNYSKQDLDVIKKGLSTDVRIIL